MGDGRRSGRGADLGGHEGPALQGKLVRHTLSGRGHALGTGTPARAREATGRRQRRCVVPLPTRLVPRFYSPTAKGSLLRGTWQGDLCDSSFVRRMSLASLVKQFQNLKIPVVFSFHSPRVGGAGPTETGAWGAGGPMAARCSAFRLPKTGPARGHALITCWCVFLRRKSL